MGLAVTSTHSEVYRDTVTGGPTSSAEGVPTTTCGPGAPTAIGNNGRLAPCSWLFAALPLLT
jgi:hypothetical protein